MGAGSPKVIWSGAAVREKSEVKKESNNDSSNSKIISQPKKKIKLVGENKDATRYSRVLTGNERLNPKFLGLPRSGQTINHVLSTAERMALEEQDRKKKVFKPIFSSTPAAVVVKREENKARVFENAKDFGEWVKSTLSAEDYKKIFTEFSNYRKKPEVMKLLDFGKRIFPDAKDYKSYMSGLRLTVSIADRAIINDVISACQDFEDDFSPSQY